MFECETGIVKGGKNAAGLVKRWSRNASRPRGNWATTAALAVWDQLHRGLCSGAATERHITLRRPAYGALLRPDIPHRTHAYMRAAERFPAVTPPWTALFSSAALHPRPLAAGVNPHSCELGTETTTCDLRLDECQRRLVRPPSSRLDMCTGCLFRPGPGFQPHYLRCIIHREPRARFHQFCSHGAILRSRKCSNVVPLTVVAFMIGPPCNDYRTLR
jgi:hypothetical protein